VKLHRFHPEADEEYADAAAHYARVSPELGGRFYDEIERAIAEVCAAPRLFRRIDADAGGTWRMAFPMPSSTSTNRTTFESSPSRHSNAIRTTGGTEFSADHQSRPQTPKPRSIFLVIRSPFFRPGSEK